MTTWKSSSTISLAWPETLATISKRENVSTQIQKWKLKETHEKECSLSENGKKKERISNEEVISYVNKNDGHICMTNLEDRRVRRQSESWSCEASGRWSASDNRHCDMVAQRQRLSRSDDLAENRRTTTHNKSSLRNRMRKRYSPLFSSK